jgi:hypothetical protein
MKVEQVVLCFAALLATTEIEVKDGAGGLLGQLRENFAMASS